MDAVDQDIVEARLEAVQRLGRQIVSDEHEAVPAVSVRGNDVLTNNIRFRSIIARRCFGVPFAGFVFVFDVGGVARNVLLRGDPFCRSQRRLPIGERFRKDAVERVGPSTIMLDNSVVDLCHDILAAVGDGTGMVVDAGLASSVRRR